MVSVPVTEVDRTAGGTCTPLLPMSAVPRVVTKLPTLLEEVVADLSSLACLTVVPCRCKGCIPTRRGAAGIAAAKAAACICACCSMHPSSTRNSWMRWSRAAQAACPAACVSSGPPGLHPQLVPPPRPPVLPMPPPPPPEAGSASLSATFLFSAKRTFTWVPKPGKTCPFKASFAIRASSWPSKRMRATVLLSPGRGGKILHCDTFPYSAKISLNLGSSTSAGRPVT
mmetsp:Transcript_35010/g.89060  ORF Transcript_35010/g.89060 Transcript_35010/m.89060 type:complete len:227 (-) Transcript_35010:116-796(-)